MSTPIIKAKNYAPSETCFVDICMDFDGCLHRYDSGWQGADIIPDPAVDGAIISLYDYLNDGLTLAIHSARSAQLGGITAMQHWLHSKDLEFREKVDMARGMPYLLEQIQFPMCKPAAKIYIDDRGYRFEGQYPTPSELRQLFTTWQR